MTSQELAVLRDKVARARLEKRHAARQRRDKTAYEQAGDAALEALREAERRAAKRAVKQLVAPDGKKRGAYKQKTRNCVYCGCFTRKLGFPRTCYGHADLPGLDPAYAAELALRGIAA